MKKLAFALLMSAASLAPAAVINVEFKFTPFVGDPVKDDKVTTVPGKAAIFINNGRGPTVDERALTEALRQGWIAGAALDVFETEPVDTANALLAMDNVIVTPHIASATARMAPETRRRLGREIATVLQGKWPRSAVNPGVLPRTGLIRWQPYPMGRGPNR